MVQDIARQYNYRAQQEQKKLVLSGSEAVTLWCDRDWMQDAVDNLVKNALDHTKSGDTIQVEWNARKICTISSNGFIAAAFHRIHRASGWVCRWQKPLWKPITAPLK